MKPSTDGWCQLELVTGDDQYALGADTAHVIVQRLICVLEQKEEAPIVGSIRGVDVSWVLSLSERHCSIYAGNEENHRVLFFQAEDGSEIAALELNDRERAEWLSALKMLS